MNQSTFGWMNAGAEWADQSGWSIGANSPLAWEREEENPFEQTMGTARWVRAYLEWTFDSGNAVHFAFPERRNFERRSAIQQFCGCARRVSDRQGHTKQTLVIDRRKSALAICESIVAEPCL